MQSFPLLVQSGDKGVVLRGTGYEPGKDGRGHAVGVGAATSAALFKMDGQLTDMAIRKADDTQLALEVNFRKFELNGSLSLWYCKGHEEWACRFRMNSDGTVTPLDNQRKPVAQLVIGVTEQGGSDLSLVARDDAACRLVFLSGGDSGLEQQMAALRTRAEAAEAHFGPLAAQPLPLLVRSPECAWLGSGGKAIVAQVHGVNHVTRCQKLTVLLTA